MNELDRVIALAENGEDAFVVQRLHYLAAQVRACVCDVGVQECPIHPGRLFSTLDRILFEKRWDARVKAAREPAERFL